jgi:UDP-N-acetylmuramate dehydrogenase
MNIQNNVVLAPYTSFGVGGTAEHFALISNSHELEEALRCTLPTTPLHVLGYGSNSLISDRGLDGMTICVRGGTIRVEGTKLIADAGAWWDDVVKTAIKNNLWGIELMSEIPGSFGGGLFINIAAYGQSLGSVVEWIDVWDRSRSSTKRLEKSELIWDYKTSIFQRDENQKYVILKACLRLSRNRTDTVTYQKAIDVAEELGLCADTLEDRRSIIIETRRRAGSLWRPNNKEPKTVGSFFRNPIVSKQQAQLVMNFDESGKSAKQIRLMNKVHGGSEQRVSAAHVMLAAGFRRGQTWGKIKLNDQNLLKIEALDGATAQDIYSVMKEIQQTCKEKLGITLESEARLLGDFS